MENFAVIGVGGFVAPRHLKAIRDNGHQVVAACDPHDSVGVLDSHFPNCRFFTEFERFDRHLEKLRRQSEDARVSWVSVCSPNYLHDAHVRLGLRVHANVICEKPLVIRPWNLDQLEELEAEFGRRVYTVLQLRMLPSLRALRERLRLESATQKHEVELSYVTRRGAWYHASWKGQQDKSGGLSMNIGIHFFDLLIWLFGVVEYQEVHLNRPDKMAGAVELERARVKWFLSVDGEDLPAGWLAKGKSAFRSILIDGEELEFSDGFTDLHTRTYEATLKGEGFGLADARPSIDLVDRIRNAEVVSARTSAHPKLARV